MPIQTTTVLPDAGQPSLDNGVEDEITASYSDVSNYGDYRVQIRETGQSAWDNTATGFQETVVGEDQTSVTFAGLEDGEAYEVRLRTETEHVTGAFTTPVEITTTFPTPAGFSAAADGPTQVTLSWTDQADNEDGFTVERRAAFAGGTSDYRTLATLDPNTESYVDSDARAGETLEYRLTAFTEDTSVRSSTSVTTPSLADREPTDAVGWAVTLERPDGVVRRPSVLDDAEVRPRLNDRPEISVPIRPDESWLDEDWEDAEMRVYRDGERLPIDTVAEVIPQPSQTELVGRGGAQLLRRVRRDIEDEAAEDAIADILTETGYTVTVDPAPATSNEPLTTLDTTEAFTDVWRNDSPTTPARIVDGVVEPLQTAWIAPPQDISAGKLVADSQFNWTVSEAVELSLGASTGWTETLDYRIPEGEVGVACRVGDNFIGALELSIDGDPADRSFVVNSSQDTPDASWFVAETSDLALSAGQHSLKLDLTSGGFGDATGQAYIDAAVVYDKRYWDGSKFVNTLNGNNRIDGGPPGLFAPVDIDLSALPIRLASGGRLEATLSSTANDQALALSPDGESFTTASNSQTIETDFADPTAQFVARVRLGGVDATAADTSVETSVTQYRTEPQTLDKLGIEYDSVASPAISQTIDSNVRDALSSIAERANLLWELQSDGDGGIEIVVTRPGQRTSDVDPSLVNWEVSKDLDSNATAAIIHGRNRRIEGEQFTADINNVALDADPIVKGSTRVYDDQGTEYVRGENEDYVVDHVIGEIKMPDLGSNLTQGETYFIDYEAETVGEYFGESHNNPRRQPAIRELPSIITEAQAQQAALYVVERSAGPVISATVTLDGQEIGYQLTEAIDPSQLPDLPGPLRVQSISEQAGTVSAELGLGQSVADVIDRLRSTLRDTARQS